MYIQSPDQLQLIQEARALVEQRRLYAQQNPSDVNNQLGTFLQVRN
jgi:hypothetical protein